MPKSLSAFVLLSISDVNSAQKISVLSPFANNTDITLIKIMKMNDAYIQYIKYHSVSSIIRQFDKIITKR